MENKVKKLVVLPVLLMMLFAGCSKSGTSDNLNWKTDLNDALAVAKKENKVVLVNFTGSDWCVWCKRLSNEVFSKSEFEDFAEKNLVLVKIDFPRNIQQSNATKYYNQQLADMYGVEGFPTVILLDKNGRGLLKTGYVQGGVDNYIQQLRQYMTHS
jgi:protein disulfide-isomerase